MQQNPSYGGNLGNCYSCFSHSMGDFFQYNSHPTIYFIIWEMHGFPHQFPIVQEKATNLIVWGEPGKLEFILFPYYGRFFSVRFPFYGILHHMGNAFVFSIISHNMGKDSQTIEWGKSGKLVPGNILQNPFYVENLGIGIHTFPIVWVLFPIRLTFCGILYNM